MSEEVEVRNHNATKWSQKVTSPGDRQDSQALSPRSQRLLDNHRQCLTELGYPLSEVVSLVRKYHDDEQTLTQHVSRLIDEAIEHPWRAINPKTSKASIAQAGQSERVVTDRRSTTRPMNKPGEAKKSRERKPPLENRQRSDSAQRRGVNRRGHVSSMEAEKKISQGEVTNTTMPNVNTFQEQKLDTSMPREDRRKTLRRDTARKGGEKPESARELRSASKTYNSKKELSSEGKAAISRSTDRGRQNEQNDGVPAPTTKGAWGRRRLVQEVQDSVAATAISVTARSENAVETCTVALKHPAPSTLAARPGMKCWAKVVSGAPENATESPSVVAEPSNIRHATEQAVNDSKEVVNEPEPTAPQIVEDQQVEDAFLPSSTVSFNFATVTSQPTKYTSVRTAATEIPSLSSPVKVTDEVDATGPVTIIERAVDKHIVIKHRPADVPKIDRRSLQQSRAPLQGMTGVDAMRATGASGAMEHGSGGKQETSHQGVQLYNRENGADYVPGRMEQYHNLPSNGGPDELYYPPAGMYPSRMPPYGYDYHDYVPYPYRPPTSRGFSSEYSGDSITYPPPHIMQSYQKPPPMNAVRPFPYENGYNAHSGSLQHPPHPGMYSVGSHGHSQIHPVPTEQHIPPAAAASEQFSTLPPIGLPPLFLQAAPPAMMHGRNVPPMESVNPRMEYHQAPYKY